MTVLWERATMLILSVEGGGCTGLTYDFLVHLWNAYTKCRTKLTRWSVESKPVCLNGHLVVNSMLSLDLMNKIIWGAFKHSPLNLQLIKMCLVFFVWCLVFISTRAPVFIHNWTIQILVPKQWARIALKHSCKRGTDYVCSFCKVKKLKLLMQHPGTSVVLK